MAITNGYCTRAEIFARLNISGAGTADQQAQIDNAVNTASRNLDSFCQRRFWLDSSVVARTFEPQELGCLSFAAKPFTDIGASSGVIVKTDNDGDGVFETTWAASDWELLPYNAAVEGPEAKPWTAIRAIGTQSFPVFITMALTRRDRVQVTAKWGWPAVPETIAEASRILATRIVKRKDAPEGVAGFSETGSVVRFTGEDRDVAMLVKDYAKVSGFA